MRYRLVFDKKYKVSGRYPVNIIGKIVVFQDGVAYINSKDTADYAKKLRYIASVEEIPEEVSVVVETVLPTEEPEAIEEPKKEEPVEEEEEEKEEGVTAEKIQELYGSLGTWSAVASHLEITTAQLRKLREELGLL
jgi:hypothetical protein